MTKYEIIDKMVENIEKVIIGKTEIIKLSLIALMCRGHLLIEDVPGVGKTSLAQALAKSINGTFNRVSFTPDVLPSDITGFSIYNRKSGDFEFRPGAVECNFLLADEINRTSPKTQSSLLEAMQEGRVSVDGYIREIEKPFMVLATQNPIEHLGTYPLPEAQLDRFFMKISIGYPTKEDEERIVLEKSADNGLEKLTSVASKEDIVNLQALVNKVHIEDSLASYIVNLVNETRKNENVLLGISPRGSIALSQAAKAFAFMDKRDYVIPEDIKSALIPVFCHRLMLTKEARIKSIKEEDVLKSILNKVNIGI